MPGYTDPQNLNRYSYVTNNPLRYVDPTGHRLVENEGGGGCSTSGYCGGSSSSGGGGGGSDCGGVGCDAPGGIPNSPGDDDPLLEVLNEIIDYYVNGFDVFGQKGCGGSPGGFTTFMNTPECLDLFANLTQDMATFFSSMGATATALTTLLGCGAGAELGCAAGYALGVELHIGFYNVYETIFSTASFMTTAYSDVLTKDTQFNNWQWDVGEDTRTGFFTWFAGSLSPEPFLDAGVDIYNSGYNHGYFCGISTILDCL